jgi:hypothetical protein
MKTTASVTFKDIEESCFVESNKPVLSLALDEIKEKLLAESDHWFSPWKMINIVVDHQWSE